jgi:hypothetical protein
MMKAAGKKHRKLFLCTVQIFFKVGLTLGRREVDLEGGKWFTEKRKG